MSIEPGDFEVESLLEHRPSMDKPNEFEYLLRWKDYGPNDDEWVLQRKLQCDNLLNDYWSSKGQPVPALPKRSKKKKLEISTAEPSSNGSFAHPSSVPSATVAGELMDYSRIGVTPLRKAKLIPPDYSEDVGLDMDEKAVRKTNRGVKRKKKVVESSSEREASQQQQGSNSEVPKDGTVSRPIKLKIKIGTRPEVPEASVVANTEDSITVPTNEHAGLPEGSRTKDSPSRTRPEFEVDYMAKVCRDVTRHNFEGPYAVPTAEEKASLEGMNRWVRRFYRVEEFSPPSPEPVQQQP